MKKDELLIELKRLGVLRDKKIEDAFRAIDRIDFILDEDKDIAYENYALSIGHEQTISQPYTLAFMFEKLMPSQGDKILDVGSGSGWSTTLLARIVGKEGQVVGVERIPELINFGKKNLSKYGYTNASILQAGSMLGEPAWAPFDKILVSAKSDRIPEELIGQLKVGGILVMPVKDVLMKITKMDETEYEAEVHPGFLFVPLIES